MDNQELGEGLNNKIHLHEAISLRPEEVTILSNVEKRTKRVKKKK